MKINNPKSQYFIIIENAKKMNRIKKKCNDVGYTYYERHHIIPSSCGGDNSETNLVLLTPEEHFYCHSLLPMFMEGRNKHKMLYAWNIMNNNHKTSFALSMEWYSTLKKEHAIAVSYDKLGVPMSVEAKKNMSLNHADVTGENNPMYGKTHSQKTKKLMSTQKLGENNPNYGKPRDVVTKNKISKSMVGNVNPLGIKRKRVKCPHCVVSGAKNVMVRWHFNNCKHKP